MNEGEMNDKIGHLGLKKKYLASLLDVSDGYVTKLIKGQIMNYDKMRKLKMIINEYEAAIKNNDLL